VQAVDSQRWIKGALQALADVIVGQWLPKAGRSRVMVPFKWGIAKVVSAR
jgi:hypothetical protein